MSPLSPNAANMLTQAAAARGDACAIADSERYTTYAQLAARAGAFAVTLRARGLKPNDRVGIFLDRTADAAAAFFGVVAAGGIAININETLKPAQIDYMLEKSGTRMLISDADMLGRLPRPLDTAAQMVDRSNVVEGMPLDVVERLTGDVAQIIFTSGSTGAPKGVAISHGNLWAVMESVTSYLSIESSDRIISLLPFSFVYGLNQLLCAVGRSATLVIERSPLPLQMVNTVREKRITLLAAVPPLWAQLQRVADFREMLPDLRVMTNAGGRLQVDVVRALREVQPNAKLFLMYGLTEVLRSTFLAPDQVDHRRDSIGRAIPGSEVFVMREDGTPCDVDEIGELVHRGPTVALGYWNDAVATERVFRSNPMRASGIPDSERVVFSGDLVRRDAEGFLYYVGRRDRMIKTLGYRVSPDEIAEALLASKELKEAVVTSEPDEQRGERIIAHVILAENGSAERLRRYYKVELPRYMQPAETNYLSDIPRNASGKYDLELLRTSPRAMATI